MAEPDDRVSRSYRGLAREEPPAALDAAILAAARESVRPRVRNRWAGPVSIAAVLVLGLGVSLRMQTEQPGIETSVPPPSSSSAEYPSPGADSAAPEAQVKEAPRADRSRDAQARAPAAKALTAPAKEAGRNVASAPAAPLPQAPGPKLSSQPAQDSVPAAAERYQQKDAPPPEALAKKQTDAPPAESARAEARPFAEAPAAAPPPPAALARVAPATPAASPAPLRAKREAAAGAVAQDSATSKPDADERATELERIARLRRDGKDAEADKALEEFRRRNPDYRIPEAIWERVRPR